MTSLVMTFLTVTLRRVTRRPKVKMADLSGTELSEEKEAEIELKKRQKRPWDDLHKSGKIGITPPLPETLGFYDISAVRREQRDLSAGKTSGPPLKMTLLSFSHS